MKIQAKGKITIPKKLRERLGLGEGIEIDMVPTDEGLLIKRCAPAEEALDGVREIPDSVLGILKGRDALAGLYSSVDEYIEDIRGR